MLPIKLRPYQIEAVNIAVKKLLAHHEPFIEVLSTGAGKSHIIAEVCKKLNFPVLVLQPSKEILEQNYSKMESLGAKNISYYSASKSSKIIDTITFATIGSIKNYELFKHFQYVIVDEADCIDPKGMESMYMKFFNAIKPKGIMGLTATPYRRVSKYFTEGNETYYTSGFEMINRIYPFFFKSIAFKIELEDLINQKYLSPIKYFLGPPPKGLYRNKSGSDYTFESVVKASDLRKTQVVKAILYCLKNHKRTIVFVPSVSNANAITALLALENIYCPTISAETSKKEREQVLLKYRKGEIKLLINVGVFLFGLDVPEIDAVIWDRNTAHPRIIYQGLGRGLRLDPLNSDKILHVYDISGSIHKIGRIEDLKIIKEADGFRDKLIGKPNMREKDLTGKPVFTQKLSNFNK